MRFSVWLTAAAVAGLLAGCGGAGGRGPDMRLAERPWEEIVRMARGSEVAFAMWAGDDRRNRHIRGPVAAALREKHGITLRVVPLGDTAEAVNRLLNEKAAGKTGGGGIDLVWINGENFRTAKQGGVLWGPFAGRLPNVGLYDEGARRMDFGTAVEDFAAPWERAQFVMGYDTARVERAPRSLGELREWVRAHPGRFTYIAPPDFTGSAFARHVLLEAGAYDPGFWKGFDEGLYRRAAAGAAEWLREWRPYLWRRGETYPPTVAELNRLFANGEVDFAMSYGPAFASVRIERGEFPATVRTFVFERGTLGNHSSLAIPFNAANAAGAMVTANELLGFETGLGMARALGTLPAQRMEALTEAQRAAVRRLPRGAATLPAEELARHFLAEPDAEYLNRWDKDWNAMVLRQ